ncbi:hypothetical protein SH1V18_17750 [Vallitalea longa]|uniref:DUF6487 domain-containing protein n=1 Tax=Vallitalea longa TaxID=2936439 RepID=A0A9W6DEA3_9FIRM|nr:PF20097 family protein [Vallitalea longa]GKX29295.1 hypothetical protein SH1V18_17750 [Vallitalea longa]
MKCPYCGKEMEQGVIQSPYEISWDKKKHLFGSAHGRKESIVLSESTMIKGCAVIAYLCRECKKIVIDYTDEKCDYNTQN